METLDLHGIRHYRVDYLVENFILLNSPPMRIIVGNSDKMQELTKSVLERYNFIGSPEHYYNLGSIIVTNSD